MVDLGSQGLPRSTIAPDRYTLKQILVEIEMIFRLREFLPENIAVPA